MTSPDDTTSHPAPGVLSTPPPSHAERPVAHSSLAAQARQAQADLQRAHREFWTIYHNLQLTLAADETRPDEAALYAAEARRAEAVLREMETACSTTN